MSPVTMTEMKVDVTSSDGAVLGWCTPRLVYVRDGEAMISELRSALREVHSDPMHRFGLEIALAATAISQHIGVVVDITDDGNTVTSHVMFGDISIIVTIMVSDGRLDGISATCQSAPLFSYARSDESFVTLMCNLPTALVRSVISRCDHPEAMIFAQNFDDVVVSVTA